MKIIAISLRKIAIIFQTTSSPFFHLYSITAHCKQGIAEGSHAKAIEMARNGLNLGLPIEQIQILTGLSLSEIQNLK